MEIDFSPIESLEFNLSSASSPEVDFGVGDVQGAIDIIKVNGTPLPVVNRTVNIPVPTRTSQLINDSNFISSKSGKIVTSVNGKTGDVIIPESKPQIYRGADQPTDEKILIWIETIPDNALITSDGKTFITSDNKTFITA